MLILSPLFPAADVLESPEDYSLETPPVHGLESLAEKAVSVPVGDVLFMAEEDEYFSFEI